MHCLILWSVAATGQCRHYTRFCIMGRPLFRQPLFRQPLFQHVYRVSRYCLFSWSIRSRNWLQVRIRATQLAISHARMTRVCNTFGRSTLFATISVSRIIVLTGFVPVGLILLRHPRLAAVGTVTCTRV